MSTAPDLQTFVAPLRAALEGASRVAVVTGVTSGIGAALVTTLLRDGFAVVGIARSREKLNATTERLGDARARWAPWPVDLASPQERMHMFGALAPLLPRVDVVVNNAAACVYESALELSSEGWSTLLETNLLAPLELVKALRPRFSRGAQIVNVSSVTSRHLPHERYAPYATTKVALDRLTEALRMELRESGIKVTSVAPGLVDTPLYDHMTGFEKVRAKFQEQIPRWLSPEDVAETIAWIVARPPHVVVGDISLYPLGQPR